MCDVSPGGVVAKPRPRRAERTSFGAIMARWAGRTTSSIRVSPNGWKRNRSSSCRRPHLSADGLVNCSPKGNRENSSSSVERTVAYLDQTGSGVETIAHLRENGRIVVMFCAFVGAPRGSCACTGTAAWFWSTTRPSRTSPVGSLAEPGVGVRSIIVVEVRPYRRFVRVRGPFHVLRRPPPDDGPVVDRKGPEGIRKYWAEKNAKSLDQLDGIAIHEGAHRIDGPGMGGN